MRNTLINCDTWNCNKQIKVNNINNTEYAIQVYYQNSEYMYYIVELDPPSFGGCGFQGRELENRV